MVLLLVVMLPYTTAILFGGPDSGPAVMVSTKEKSGGSGNITVSIPKSYGTEALPIEEYLKGSLAASIPAAYEEEALKAQAVILRSTAYHATMQKESEAVYENGIYKMTEE